jgi:hypothetical protein
MEDDSQCARKRESLKHQREGESKREGETKLPRAAKSGGDKGRPLFLPSFSAGKNAQARVAKGPTYARNSTYAIPSSSATFDKRNTE